MTIKEKLRSMLFWGFILWFTGFVLGVVLFLLVPKELIGWIITPFGALLTIVVLIKKIKRPELMCYFGTGIVWTIMAVLLDYFFLVKMFNIGTAYYKPDVFLYYALTFTLPPMVGYWKFKHKNPEDKLF